MKINEVAALVGMSEKNIRYYETEDLVRPGRNSKNGYREYGCAEADALRRIKLLRKLGFSLEEIRRMQSGALTVGAGMQQHLLSLAQERDKLDAAALLCQELTACCAPLSSLDAQVFLARMEQMETEGTAFMDKQHQDTRRRRYLAPALSALVMAVLMGGCIWLMLWAFRVDPAGAPPLPLLILLVGIPAVVIVGVGIALIQRFRELNKREIDDAKQY